MLLLLQSCPSSLPCGLTREYSAKWVASLSSPTLLRAPLQELAEQSFAISLALGYIASEAIQERMEIAADIFSS